MVATTYVVSIAELQSPSIGLFNSRQRIVGGDLILLLAL